MRKGNKLVSSYLEKYKIIELIQNGGNSEVYKVQTNDGKVYALKLLNKGLSSEKVKRFKNEMSFCFKTTHPNIIKIIDNGITDDKEQMFYVMPYYDMTLRKFMDESHSFEEKIQMYIKILEGVRSFHVKRIIHRDIKPENILISSEDNVPVISDFGIAHFCEEDIITQIETRVGSKMANFQYASPEQREKNGVITNKSDIYALGLIFNEMFTGSVPFGNSYKSVGGVNDNYAFLDKIIDKMISQDPANRYNSVDEVIHEIKVQIELKSKTDEIAKLKEIKYEMPEEEDILVLEPPKLIDFKYDDTIGQLFLYLDKRVNDLWIDCMTKNSYSSLLSYGPEKFHFEGNVAIVNLRATDLHNLQTIIDYFKSWVKNANTYYPNEIKSRKQRELFEKEQTLKAKIKHEEMVKKALENIKI